jgi:hypothetical protein
MMLSDRPSLPISVRGSRSGTRRFRCPAAISPAVSSISTSGRRFARTTAKPIIASTIRIRRLTLMSSLVRYAMVWFRLPRLMPTTSVPGCWVTPSVL